MAKQRYHLKQSSKQLDRGKFPVDKPIVVYYRQSTAAQVGNISTAIQQEDLPKYAEKLGWHQNNIILIDTDEGISGQKSIDERQGMSDLYGMIISRKISAVLCADVDRLFRDKWNIEPSKFRRACTENNVMVITPRTIYDFCGPDADYSEYRWARDTEMAADFIKRYIQGKLYDARMREAYAGKWTGHTVPLGFLVDESTKRYTPFIECKDVIASYYQKIVANRGNIRATAYDIMQQGPYLPDFDNADLLSAIAERGCRFIKHAKLKRGDNGMYYPKEQTLRDMFTNIAYIGSFVINGQIIEHNHPGIVPENLFWQAFNLMSPVMPDGTPNPDYRSRLSPKQQAVRGPYRKPEIEASRGIQRPLYEGLIWSQTKRGDWRKAGVKWSERDNRYSYHFNESRADWGEPIWARSADLVDRYIDDRFLSMVSASCSEDTWIGIIASFSADLTSERASNDAQIRALVDEIETVSLNMSRAKTQSAYTRMETRLQNLESDLKRQQAKRHELLKQADKQQDLMHLRTNLIRLYNDWNKAPIELKRLAVDTLVSRVEATARDGELDLIVYWIDGKSTTTAVPYRHDVWLKADLEKLVRLIDSGEDQILIAQEFPHTTWRELRSKYYAVCGKGIDISPLPIHDHETFENYIARIGEGEDAAITYAGKKDHWTRKQCARLMELVRNEAGQLEIAREYPYRRWVNIRRKITDLCGSEVNIPDVGKIKANQTYSDLMQTAQEGVNSGARSLTKAPIKPTEPRLQPINFAVLMSKQSTQYFISQNVYGLSSGNQQAAR
jgi:DNA invertase Pin-like site-specific DNA recombinase